jgi:hypothetical protein
MHVYVKMSRCLHTREIYKQSNSLPSCWLCPTQDEKNTHCSGGNLYGDNPDPWRSSGFFLFVGLTTRAEEAACHILRKPRTQRLFWAGWIKGMWTEQQSSFKTWCWRTWEFWNSRNIQCGPTMFAKAAHWVNKCQQTSAACAVGKRFGPNWEIRAPLTGLRKHDFELHGSSRNPEISNIAPQVYKSCMPGTLSFKKPPAPCAAGTSFIVCLLFLWLLIHSPARGNFPFSWGGSAPAIDSFHNYYARFTTTTLVSQPGKVGVPKLRSFHNQECHKSLNLDDFIYRISRILHSAGAGGKSHPGCETSVFDEMLVRNQDSKLWMQIQRNPVTSNCLRAGFSRVFSTSTWARCDFESIFLRFSRPRGEFEASIH